MKDEGILTFYNLENVSTSGSMPVERLKNMGLTAFYANKQIGMQRRYLSKGADYHLDKLVHAYNTELPEDAKYVILEDGRQYLIGDAEDVVDEDAIALSLERLGKNYEVLNPVDSNSP